MGRNLYKLTESLMTPLSCRFDDVIKIRQQKSRRFSRVFDEYLKNGSADFYQTYVILRQSSIVSFEAKGLKTGHSLLP